MWRGLYTAATGMVTESKRTDVIANNIANAATAGYKKDVAVHREFETMLIRRVNDHEDGGSGGPGALGTDIGDVTKFKGFGANANEHPVVGQLGMGDYISEIAVDHSQGAYESTGNAYDFAIAGQGFFAVQTQDGIRYTRNGAFFRNQNGVLQDIRGNNLLDITGNAVTIPPNVTPERFSVGADGTISVRGANEAQPQILGRIQVVQFNNPQALRKQGDNLFYATADAQPQPATGEVLQGILEKSNTEIVTEMVELIHNHRLYEAGSKAVTTQDAMLDAAVNQLGRIGS